MLRLKYINATSKLFAKTYLVAVRAFAFSFCTTATYSWLYRTRSLHTSLYFRPRILARTFRLYSTKYRGLYFVQRGRNGPSLYVPWFCSSQTARGPGCTTRHRVGESHTPVKYCESPAIWKLLIYWAKLFKVDSTAELLKPFHWNTPLSDDNKTVSNPLWAGLFPRTH